MLAGAAPELSISIQTIGRGYERIGTGQFAGVIAEQIHVNTANPGGADTIQFQLRRDPRFPAADLTGLNRIYAELAGVGVFSGRIRATPSKRGMENVVDVVGEGLYASLNDDQYDKVYVINDLSQFVDSRSLLTTTLGGAAHTASAQVSSEADGTVFLGWTGDATTTVHYAVSVRASCVLDLGPNNVATDAYCTFDSSNNTAALTKLYLQISDRADDFNVNGSNANVTNGSGATGSLTVGPVTTGSGRYVQLFHNVETAFSASNDFWFRVKSILVTTKSSYINSGSSVLTASLGIKDVLTNAAPMISTDQSLIQSTSYHLPSYSTGGRKSPQQIITDFNSYHLYQLIFTNDPIPKAIYEPVPTTPEWVVGEGDRVEFSDTGANDTSQVFNQTICTFQTGDGQSKEVVALTDPYYSAIMSRVPNFYFRMNDPSGPIMDWSGRGIVGIPSGSPTYSITGPRTISTGISFNGTTDFFKISNAATAGPNNSADIHPGDILTLSAWFKRSASGVVCPIYSNATNNDFLVWVTNADKIVLRNFGVADDWVSTATYTDTTSWHHLVVVKNAATITVYLDGAAIAGTTTNHTVLVTTGDGFIGQLGDATNFTHGSLTEISLHPTAWTAADVSSVYAAMFMPTNITIADKQGITKSKTLQLSGRSVPAAAYQIASAYLNSHNTSPAAGQIILSGNVRRYADGSQVPCGFLQSGDAILVENAYNPDTGTRGRTVIAQQTSYDHDSLQNTVTVDTRKDWTDALLERVGVVTR